MALGITRADLRRLLKDNLGDRGEAISERKCNRAMENGLRHVSKRRAWEFLCNATVGLAPTPSYEPAIADNDATVNHAATSVTLAANAPTDVVGAFIEFNGERGWYEITAGGGTTTLTLERAYRNQAAGNLANVSFKILYPTIALPANYRRRQKLYDTLRGNYIAPAEADALWYVNAQTGQQQAGQPTSYAVIPKRHDSNVSHVLLFPAPTGVESYELAYIRHAGWFSSATPATSTWKMRATADTDYVDWPESKMGILETAILAHAYLETKAPEFAPYVSMYKEMLEDEAQDDHENAEIQELGDQVMREPQEFARIVTE